MLERLNGALDAQSENIAKLLAVLDECQQREAEAFNRLREEPETTHERIGQ